MKCRVWNLLMVLMLVTVVGCSDSGPEKETSSNEKDDSNQTAAAESAGDSDGGKATPGGADDAVAVDPPNPGAALQPDSNAAAADTGLAVVTDDFIGGLIVHPRRMTQSPLGQEVNVDEFVKTTVDENMPFAVSDLERVIVLVGGPRPPFGFGPSSVLFAFTFATPEVLANIREEELPSLKAVKHAGKEYFRRDYPDDAISDTRPVDEGRAVPPEKEPADFDCDDEPTAEAAGNAALQDTEDGSLGTAVDPGLPPEEAGEPLEFEEPGFDGENVAPDREVFYFPSGRTMVLGPEPAVKKILEGKGPSGPLAELAGSVDLNHDFVAFGVMGPLNEFLDQLPPDALRGIPQQANLALNLRKFIDSAVITTDLSGPHLVQLAIDSPDGDAAKQLHAGIKLLVQLGQAAFADNREQIAAELGPEVPPGAIKIVSELVAGVATGVKGDRVSLTVKQPASWNQLPGIVKELMASAQATAAVRKRQNMAREAAVAFLIARHETGAQKLIPAAAPAKEGGPPVSWRVRALPHLEHKDLYDEYRLDEPWDSENNLKLLKKMPRFYGDDPDGRTRFMVFTGEGSLFPTATAALPFNDVKDGESTTILLVEAGPEKAVPWTKPQDLAFDPKDPAAALGEVPQEGFTAVFLDLHIDTLPAEIDGEELKALITPAGGERSIRGGLLPGGDGIEETDDLEVPLNENPEVEERRDSER